jgi:hypothetical protein
VLGVVYRAPRRNEHGDPVDADGNPVRLSGDGVARVGTINGLVPGGDTVTTVATRGDVVSTAGLIGAPVDSPTLLRHGDILEIDGTRYAITGLRMWGHANSLTGTVPTHYWIKATATIN